MMNRLLYMGLKPMMKMRMNKIENYNYIPNFKCILGIFILIFI